MYSAKVTLLSILMSEKRTSKISKNSRSVFKTFSDLNTLIEIFSVFGSILVS